MGKALKPTYQLAVIFVFQTMAKDDKRQKHSFDPILPDLNDWPIVKLSENKRSFIKEVVNETVKRVLGATKPGQLDEEIASTLYQERIRMQELPWISDPKDEKEFWDEINHRLLESSVHNLKSNVDTYEEKAILQDIVTRYANEITGRFDVTTYKFGRKALPHGFERLLSANARTNPVGLLSKPKSIYERIQITGELEQIRKVAKQGTIVVVPTHFSNMDSLIMGWAIEVLGLPAFLYGAGSNLFNIRLLAYFMNRLGAYKVDRRKKNMLYLSTLKTYSALALHKGCHSMFFPGGSRSRSGAIARRLKLGLLGTAIEAQRLNFEKNMDSGRKIIIVPVVVNYHFVLEAPTLIAEYLQRQGRERFYLEQDELSTSYRVSKLLVKFFTASSRIALSFGKPMDLFGNIVNDQGESIDERGRTVDVRKYFMTEGQLKKDPQRDAQYTRMLAAQIVREYYRNNIVFSSHLLAFTAFEMIKKQHKKLDLYELLRLPEKELEIAYTYFAGKVEELLAVVEKMCDQERIKIAPHLKYPLEGVINHGLKHLGQYHAQRPLRKNQKGNIVTEDLKILFYYHNRLTGYDLEQYI